MAIPSILSRENVLLIAPTGSGKTEAVLLPIFSNFIRKNATKGISIVYITPLRALNRDMLRRLSFWASKLDISIEVRHGDTEVKFRRRQALYPPNMLVTTPETLQAILPGSRMKQHLSHIEHVIVDEVHGLASSKRGVQLTIALERLYEIAGREFQRIGLSATVANPHEVAKFIAGTDRKVKVIEAVPPKGYRYLVETPIPEEGDYDLARRLRTSPEAAARIRRITELVDSHNSTLVFVNSRQNAEMLGHKFSQLKRFDIAVHHGSLSREERAKTEDQFKAGVLKAIICTSTLELGIDIGNVDLVIQYFSPRQVTSLIQRVGRSGHTLDRLSQGVIVTAYPDDTLESVAAVESACKRKLEPLLIHENALDVLAHQVAGILLDKGDITSKKLLIMLRKAYPYRNLTENRLLDVVDYLDWLNELRVEQEGNILRRTRKTRRYYYENLSMIPDERRYPIVNVISDRKIGTLGDEFMALRVRLGLNFICRGRVWRIVQIEEETGIVYVVPSEDPLAAIPGWDGEMLPVPFNLAQETGKKREEIAEALEKAGKAEIAEEKLSEKFALDKSTLVETVKEIREHLEQGAQLPTHNHVLLEAFEKHIIIHACFGETVNRTLGCIFDARLSDQELITGWWNDGYRILIETPRKLKAKEIEKLPVMLFTLSSADVETAFNEYLEASFPFSSRMKFIAERFGALPRGKTMGPRRLRQLREQFKKTPIFDETLREGMLEKVDIQKVKEIMEDVNKGKITVSTLHGLDKPTPLAFHILAKYSDISELMAPERVLLSNIDRMVRAIEAREVTLLCLSCAEWTVEKRIRNLPEHPTCEKCGARLLALVRFNQDSRSLKRILEKRLKNKEITKEDLKDLTYARHTADLILSYGRKAIVALEVRGVGPETAFRILGKMHQEENEFYMDLLKAKIQYLRTREYWENRENRLSSK